MQVQKKQTQGLMHDFTVTVSADEIEKHVQEELTVIGKKAKLPGFRPGKIPMNVLKQRYSKDVMGEVLQNAVNKATRDVIEENKLRPALQPDIKITTFEEGKELAFDLSIEVLPEVPALDYAKITVDEFVFEVPTAEIDESLVRLAKSRQHFHTKDGAAAKGDTVKIDFTGKLDGVAFEGGTGKNFKLELGSGQFIPGFEDQLVGSKAGDNIAVNVTFPEQYHSAALAGKAAVFDVVVHEVQYPHAPELNDEFAKGLGFDNLDALRDAVRGQIAADYEGAARAKSKKQLFDKLDDVVKFDVPAKMLSMEFENIWKQVMEAKKAGDPSLQNQDEAALKKEYEAISKRRVKLGILLSDVGRANNIQITREELSAAVMQQARMYPGQEEKVFEFYRKNPQQIDELRGPILEEKAVDFILGKVSRNKVNVSADSLFADDTEANTDGKKPSKKK